MPVESSLEEREASSGHSPTPAGEIVGLLARSRGVSAIVGLLRSRTISHHLSRLADAGLASARAEDISRGVFVSRRFFRHDHLQRNGCPSSRGGVDRSTFDRKGTRRRFTEFSTQEKKYRVLLRHVLRDFRATARTKVNEILLHYSDDTARLRRSLVDFGFDGPAGAAGTHRVRSRSPREPAAELLHACIDVGSTTVKLAILFYESDNCLRNSATVERTLIGVIRGRPLGARARAGTSAPVTVAVTGSGGLSVSQWLELPSCRCLCRRWIPDTDSP